jgi:hypothetical protein
LKPQPQSKASSTQMLFHTCRLNLKKTRRNNKWRQRQLKVDPRKMYPKLTTTLMEWTEIMIKDVQIINIDNLKVVIKIKSLRI